MTKFKFGNVVLVTFPQSDGSQKKRPAMVVLDTGDDDIVLVPITTTERKGKGDYKINDWKEAGLVSQSWLRLAKISCLEKLDIDYNLGQISNFDKSKIIASWKKLYRF